MRLANRTTSMIAAGALVVVAFLPSCYPGNDLTVSEADVVVTTFNPDVDFAQLGSYALIDSVFHLVPEGQQDEISRAYDAQILQRVRDNMGSLGFSESASTADDVIMVVGITATDYTGYYSYPCWYYCWGYPPYWGSYSFRVGSILINMTRRTDTGASQIPVAWLAGLNGYSDKNSNLSRIRSGIDQAFSQSKYLGAGK